MEQVPQLPAQEFLFPRDCFLDSGPLLTAYEHYLSVVAGLSPATCNQYLHQVRKFLSALPTETNGSVRLSLSSALTFVDPVSGSRRARSGRACAIRSLLRFLNFKGLASPSSVRSILVPSRHPDRTLPVGLTEAEIDRIFREWPEATPAQRRNRVILLLLARLGLRGGEVCNLRLGDIDWVRGEIRIGEGKTRRERRYPMSQEIGDALSSYLLNDRPQTSTKEVFVCHRPPFEPLSKHHYLTRIIRRDLQSLGIRDHGGSHLFRHATATRLVCSGASFKQVSDLLGHQSVGSTFIYAKLDLETLLSVALPWPGGA